MNKQDKYWKGVPRHTRDFAEVQCRKNRERQKRQAEERLKK